MLGAEELGETQLLLGVIPRPRPRHALEAQPVHLHAKVDVPDQVSVVCWKLMQESLKVDRLSQVECRHAVHMGNGCTYG